MKELFLIAQIGGRWIAVEASAVDSAVNLGPVVAVPCAPAAVRGLAALRSRVVTVIDTRVALGLSPTPTAGCAVITRLDGHYYAFLVDAFEDVCPLKRLPLSSGLALANDWARSATGIVERDDEPLLVLDLGALVPGVTALAA